MEKKGSPNRLINESSPYLLQHAYNPVDWYPWGEEALRKAKTEDKPILVSIGYAACHWCHVMEHQSFESDQIAAVMNEHFVCIKVDREERPDVDQIYMDAVQTMGIRGGWPLHVILNPDGKPFYGGTYFPPQQWANLLLSIAKAFREHRAQLEESAQQFAEALNRSELQKYGLGASEATAAAVPALSESDFHLLYQNFAKRFDRDLGGMQPEPKFPMPVNYRFLLRYYESTGNREALDHTLLSLREMAYGGLYDQAGGGFARYSTDAAWLVPHFEKMLYDNGQLVSVYAEAFQVTPLDLFREVVYETVDFVERELTSPEGGFYSSLDADSEGEEGKFYVFTQEELEKTFGSEYTLFSTYYNTEGGEGNWEHGRNILHRHLSDEEFARENDLSVEGLRRMVGNWKSCLMQLRSTRTRPGLDDKILTSWNALMLHGLTDAYRVFGEEKFLRLALANASFLQASVVEGNRLFHTFKHGRATIPGFLEDYALLIRSYIALYEVTFEEKWLRQAKTLTDYTLTHFLDEEEKLFFFVDKEGEQLIARKKELFDNVVPGSNSVMATNLHMLGLLFDEPRYSELSDAMLRQVLELVVKEPSHLANWATLYSLKLKPTAEIAIVGPEAQELRRQFGNHFLPNAVWAGSNSDSALPLLADRMPNGRTTIFVCYNKACQLPVHSVAEALDQLAVR